MAGKSYTMKGPSLEEEESRGMIARAVLQIFNNTHDLEAKGWQVSLTPWKGGHWRRRRVGE